MIDCSRIKEDLYPEVLKTIYDLCAITAPSNHEKNRAAYCKKWLESAGASSVTIDEALNVVCPINVTEENALVVFMAHMDTVFPDSEPTPVTEKDGKLYCPGIGDDTANLAIMMSVCKYLLSHKDLVPSYGFLFVANSCEEGLGNLKGSKQIWKDYSHRIKEVISFDGVIEYINDKAVGSDRYRITVETEGGHSFSNFGNKNAIHYLAKIINDLYSVELPHEGYKVTYNVGQISGGTSVNTIAQKAEMLFEYRSDNEAGITYMKKEFNRIIQSYLDGGIKVHVDLIGSRPGMGILRSPERQAGLVSMADCAIVDVTGRHPKCKSGSTDCNIPLSNGIPAISFGLISGSGAHTREEYIIKDSINHGIEIAYKFISNYLK